MPNSNTQDACPSELTALLQDSNHHGISSESPADETSSLASIFWARLSYFVLWAIIVYFVLLSAISVVKRHRAQGDKHEKHQRDTKAPSSLVFPDDFVWGTATSSFQIEGATHDDGRGESIWDTFCRRPDAILDHSNGDVACDHYHRMEEDVQLMKEMGIQAYRFSIAWPRILPDASGEVNAKGIAFYSRLIDTLLQHGIEPWVTLFHWDLPQYIEDEHEGWLSRDIVDLFGEYARVCFEAFGDRVQHWITLNEAWTVAIVGYGNGEHAPGRSQAPATEPYLAGHHMILAHARAAGIYHTEYAAKQGGQIGVSHNANYKYPKSDSAKDREAAERAMLFQMGWFADPIWNGDYPKEMRERIGDRLPRFTEKEKDELLGSTDFLGLNHYSSEVVAEADWEGGTYDSDYWVDVWVEWSDKREWRKNDMGWGVVPDGLRDTLLWLSRRYKTTIFITENGTAEHEPNLESALDDHLRRDYFERYLGACAEAIEQGVNVRGYFAWSMMDNFEWQYGYTKRFGLVYVDFVTQARTLKRSARWYAATIASNGAHVVRTKPTGCYQ